MTALEEVIGVAGGDAGFAGDGAAGLSGVPESDDERAAGADRLGSAAASGGIQEEMTILQALPDTAREHRAAGDGDAGIWVICGWVLGVACLFGKA